MQFTQCVARGGNFVQEVNIPFFKWVEGLSIVVFVFY